MGITHSWNGTVLTITSDSGTSSADLKGEKGDTGVRGAQGIAGKTIDNLNIIDMQYTDTVFKASTKENVTITDSIPFVYPIEAKVTQSIFDYEISNNKLNEKTVSNDYMQNTSFILNDDAYVEVGQEAIFSFDVVGNVESLSPTMLYAGDWGFEAVAGVDNTIKLADNGRYYLEIKGQQQTVMYINWGLNYDDTETYLDNCAMRFDGSLEYEPYGKTKIPLDLTEIQVIEETTEQAVPVNADGTVSGLMATGENMSFKLDKYNDKCMLTVYYKREVSAVIDELKKAIISLGGKV